MIPPESTDEARPDQNFEILDGHGEQEVPDESGAQETPAVTEPETEAEAEAETTAPASESPWRWTSCKGLRAIWCGPNFSTSRR